MELSNTSQVTLGLVKKFFFFFFLPRRCLQIVNITFLVLCATTRLEVKTNIDLLPEDNS